MAFEICFICMSLKCIFILANSTDPDKISYLPASHLGDKDYIVFQNTPLRGSFLQTPHFTFPFFRLSKFKYSKLVAPNKTVKHTVVPQTIFMLKHCIR